jgi:hypothetical protein
LDLYETTQHVRSRFTVQISIQQNSSPTPVFQAIDQFVKATEGTIPDVTLLKATVAELEEGNQTLSKAKKALY